MSRVSPNPLSRDFWSLIPYFKAKRDGSINMFQARNRSLKKVTSLSASLVLAALSMSAHADVDFGRGRAFYQCGEGGQLLPMTETSPNRISFDVSKLQLMGRQGDAQLNQRVSCAATIPISVPEGFRVGISMASISGKVLLEGKAKAQANLDVFFSGDESTSKKTSFEGPLEGGKRFTLTNQDKRGMRVIWAECGESQILRVQASLMTSVKRHAKSYAEITADRLGVSYRIEKCE
jgi:hypothetical protein